MPERDVPVFDFRVLSEGGPQKPKPGDTWSESVTKSDDWQPGPENLGQVTIESLRGGGPRRFKATFDLRGFSTITVEGAVPGGDEWRGPGTATATMDGREPQPVDIEFHNPKGWG